MVVKVYVRHMSFREVFHERAQGVRLRFKMTSKDKIACVIKIFFRTVRVGKVAVQVQKRAGRATFRIFWIFDGVDSIQGVTKCPEILTTSRLPIVICPRRSTGASDRTERHGPTLVNNFTEMQHGDRQ